jgi:hypothetical protein
MVRLPGNDDPLWSAAQEMPIGIGLVIWERRVFGFPKGKDARDAGLSTHNPQTA